MKKTDSNLSPELAAVKSTFISQKAKVEEIRAEVNTFNTRLSTFANEIRQAQQAIEQLGQQRKELEIAVGLGTAGLSDVDRIIKEITEVTTKLDSLGNIRASIQTALEAKEKELSTAKDQEYRDRGAFLHYICNALIEEMVPSLRLLFAAHISANGGISNFDALLGNMVRAANIRDLSDQKAELARRFGFEK